MAIASNNSISVNPRCMVRRFITVTVSPSSKYHPASVGLVCVIVEIEYCRFCPCSAQAIVKLTSLMP